MTSAYDWFLKVEMARAEGSARRLREESDRAGMLRRATAALSKSGPTQGRGVNTRSRKSVLGFSGLTRGGDVLRAKAGVDEHRSGNAPKGRAPNVRTGRGVGASGSAALAAKPVFAPSVKGNAKLAAGHQPVVIKVVSYAGGARRAGATAKYVQRDKVVLETHDSKLLDNHDAVEAEINTWAEQFDTRKPSQDVTTFGIFIPGVRNDAHGRAELRAAVDAAFYGHAHAWRYEVHEDQLSARAVVVMSGLQERFGIVEQGGARRLSAQSQQVIAGRFEEAKLNKARVETMSAPGHGREGASYQLRKLGAGGPLQHEGGEVKSVQDAKDLAREWAPQLRSRGPRDTMHVVFSAKSTSTEEHEAFRKAVRLFLHETFPDHKFMFGLHADKQGRIHAHAVIAVRGDNGEKLRPSRLTFLAWRESFAEKAQAQGLKLVATVARQQVSSQSYSKFDKAIVDAADNPRPGREAADIAYNRRFPHVAAAARHRMSVAKGNPPTWAVTEKQRAVANSSLASWQDIATSLPNNSFAQKQVKRLETSLQGGQVIARLLDMKAKPAPVASDVKSTLQDMKQLVAATAAALTPEARDALQRRSEKILNEYAGGQQQSRMAETRPIEMAAQVAKGGPQDVARDEASKAQPQFAGASSDPKATPEEQRIQELRLKQQQVLQRLKAEAAREGPEKTKPTRLK